MATRFRLGPRAAFSEWMRFFQEMGDLNHVTFERLHSQYSASFLTHPTKPLEFAPMSDGEPRAMSMSRFIAAKSRVARLKPLTIPCLELQAAVLATRLYQSIAEESRMQFEKVVFFSDSNIVLSWIRSQAREFKPFVSARVAEIQSNSDPSQWRHVPGELNVADDVSRGIPAQRLIGRWKQGPEFLRLPEEEFTGSPEVIDCKKFSNWRKLVRTSSYVFIFIRNLRIRCQAKKFSRKPWTPDALEPWTIGATRIGESRELLGQRKPENTPRLPEEGRAPTAKPV